MKSFYLKRSNLSSQFFRYFIVGGFAFAVDFALLYVLTEFFGVYYLVSASAAFLVGLTLNYALSVTWVFSHRSVGNRLHEFAIFSGIGLMGLAFNAALMWVLTEAAGLHYLVSKVIATALIFLFNFGAKKALLFSIKTGHQTTTLKSSDVK